MASISANTFIVIEVVYESPNGTTFLLKHENHAFRLFIRDGSGNYEFGDHPLYRDWVNAGNKRRKQEKRMPQKMALAAYWAVINWERGRWPA